MPALENPRHERFAQELAKGKTADEAYQIAGYKANRHNAATLGREQHISTRVAEIVERGAVKAETTVERLLEAGWGLFDAAKGKEDFGAASATMERIAKIAGLWVDQSKQQSAGVVTVFSSEPMTADEWSAKFAPQTIQ